MVNKEILDELVNLVFELITVVIEIKCMGIRLKRARMILISMAISTRLPNSGIASRLKRWKIPVKIRATIMLARGPATATLKICLLVRIEKLTGIGFAQPKCIRSGRITVPNRLICERGFSVKRPILLAVSSPYL